MLLTSSNFGEWSRWITARTALAISSISVSHRRRSIASGAELCFHRNCCRGDDPSHPTSIAGHRKNRQGVRINNRDNEAARRKLTMAKKDLNGKGPASSREK